jgi:hypothetical protein
VSLFIEVVKRVFAGGRKNSNLGFLPEAVKTYTWNSDRPYQTIKLNPCYVAQVNTLKPLFFPWEPRKAYRATVSNSMLGTISLTQTAEIDKF